MVAISNQQLAVRNPVKRVHVADVEWGEIPLERILPNPEQPRRTFDARAMRELADSIRESGVRTPIQVEQAGEYFILHAGERRTKAARMAGLEYIPAVISPCANPAERLVLALVENVQREQMSPVEEALAYERLSQEYGLTPRDISRQTGKAYTFVCSRLQLAKVDPEIQGLMQARRLSTEAKVVKALMDIEDRAARLSMARRLAGERASAKNVVKACQKYARLQQVAAEHENDVEGTPAMRVIKTQQDQWPEWDALYQLGKVPPWPVVNDAVMATCDTCALRPVASETTCGSCALVAMVRRMVRDVNNANGH